MRIAVFHHLRAGGAKRALYESVKGLVARGHTVDAYTFESADEQFLPLAEVASRVHVEPLTLPGPFQTRWLPLVIQYLNLGRRLQALSALESAHARLAARIDAGGYDVAFVHHDHLIQSPYVLHQLSTPSVYYCQEPLRRYYERPFEEPPAPVGWKGRARALWYGPVEPIFERRHKADDAANARAAGLILANSAYSREAIARAYGTYATVAPLGVDAEHFRPMALEKERAVVTVGRFQANKDQALVIEAAARLPEDVRPTVILVGEATGTAQYRDHLVALARERGVTIELLEHVSDEVLVAAYNRARFAVYTPVMEPFGFVPLEAGACGLPTVGVREGGVRETIRHGETGLLAERTPEAVAEAMARLLADEALTARLGAAARADVLAHWTWARNAEAIEAHLARTAGA